MFAENSIAIARDGFVEEVANRLWQYPPNSRQRPNSAQLIEHMQDRVGTREQSLVALLEIFHHVDRVEIVRVVSVTRQHGVGKFTL